jgi:tetratricopeptide (TPR) repeat protein
MRVSTLRITSLISFFGALILLFTATQAAAQESAVPAPDPQVMHRDAVWLSIAAHLPDPATASPQTLELQADVLRARRYPDEAMKYYKYALDRGGNPESLQNKIGLTHLQLGHDLLARVYFQQMVKDHPNNAEAWNNLGAVEYMRRNYSAAEHDYKRSIKINSKSAVFHSNLGLAYMERKKFIPARKELDAAMKLDPDVFTDQGGGGVSAHFMSAADQGRFCYEMARTYAESGNETEMLHWLAKSSEYGVNVMKEMTKDRSLAKYIKDPRVLEIVHATDTLNNPDIAKPAEVKASSAPTPPAP